MKDVRFYILYLVGIFYCCILFKSKFVKIFNLFKKFLNIFDIYLFLNFVLFFLTLFFYFIALKALCLLYFVFNRFDETTPAKFEMKLKAAKHSANIRAPVLNSAELAVNNGDIRSATFFLNRVFV